MNDIYLYVLEIIKRKNSYMPLIGSGYSYLQIIKAHNFLLEKGYIELNEQDISEITAKGNHLLGLLSKKNKFRIEPLKQFEIEKMDIEDVFLP